ncbi:MAG: mechanosensitive ion channel family protein, partial [Pontiella sp.]|nr:mechanosensitive ion channel family protein [Pontiella sp.]
MLEETVIAGNTWGHILILLGWVFGALLLGAVVKILLVNFGKSKRFEEKEILQVTFRALARPIPFLFFAIGLKCGLNALEFGKAIDAIIADSLSVLFTVAITFFIYSLVDVLDYAITHFTKKTHTRMDDMMAPMVRKSLRITIVVLALVQVAQILSDKPITSILTGLGVGGLAVALAAQETIKNFFGSLVIFADKPFELGERVKVNGHDGGVEEVGFRSTRI